MVLRSLTVADLVTLLVQHESDESNPEALHSHDDEQWSRVMSWSLEPFSLSHSKNQPNGRSISDTSNMFVLSLLGLRPSKHMLCSASGIFIVAICTRP